MFQGKHVFQSSNLFGFPRFPQAILEFLNFDRLASLSKIGLPSSEFEVLFEKSKPYIYIYTMYDHFNIDIQIDVYGFGGACRAK